MKKSTMTLIIVAILVVGAVGVFALTGSDKDNDKASESTTPTTSSESSSSDDQSQTPASSSDNQATPDQVEIEDFAFTPATITIKKGTKVTWTNKDSVGHTVTPDEESSAFQGSSMLNQDDSYSFTFNMVGTYTYHCQPHPQMTGKVVVTE
jgi:amicyanin